LRALIVPVHIFPLVPITFRTIPVISGYETGYQVAKTGYDGVGVLTDTAIRKAKAQDKPYKLSDTNGLHVYVTKAGSKIFRYRYEFLGKEKNLVIGDYPKMGLLDARRARDEARQLLKSGKDPSAQKKLEKAIQRSDAVATFEVVAKEWFDLASTVWAPGSYALG